MQTETFTLSTLIKCICLVIVNVKGVELQVFQLFSIFKLTNLQANVLLLMERKTQCVLQSFVITPKHQYLRVIIN